MKPFYSRYIFVATFTLVLTLQFNNCSPIQSQLGVVSGVNTSSNNQTPYVLQCLQSSDAAKISSQLAQSVQSASLQNQAVTSKISSLDWDQDTDLVLTLDHRCLQRNGFSDSILKYIDQSQINLQLKRSAYVIEKENISYLTQFIDDVLASECTISANKNAELRVSADPYSSQQKHLVASSVNMYGIELLPVTMPAILNFVSSGSHSSQAKVKVAVIDTGIDTTHPDLAPSLARNSNGSIKGYNTTSQASMGYLQDSGYHGTHVAGLIAAQYDNNVGVTGVYGRNIELYNFRVSNNGETMSIASIVNAIQLAVDVEKVDVINMSFSTSQDYLELRQAINDAMAAGVVVVVAAGNGNDQGVGQTLNSSFSSYPAMYSTSSNQLITVGSLDLKSGTISKFSNRSSTYVDILAPGSNGDIYTTSSDNREGIFSTVPLSYNSVGVGAMVDAGGGYIDIISGTSMAAPLVTGSIASIISMAKSRNYNLTGSKVKTWIRGFGSPKNSQFSNFSANGSYLNLATLFNYARSEIQAGSSTSPTPAPSPTPTPPPSVSDISIQQQPVSRQAVLNESIQFSISAQSSSNLSYQWFKDGLPVSGAQNASYSIAQISTNDAGLYYVRVTSSNGSYVDSQAVALTVGLSYCSASP